RPLYRGHSQPRFPGALGFYDLRLPEVREAQTRLARNAGIEGFLYWHYWFGNGRRLLERPFKEVLESGQPDFPFALAWANQSWTGVWQGRPGKTLAEQLYPGRADYEAHFEWARRAFEDPRYIRIEGKPLFVLYAPHEMPDTREFADIWRELAHRAGLSGLFLASIHIGPGDYRAPMLDPFDAVTPLTPQDYLKMLPGGLGAKVTLRARARDFSPFLSRLTARIRLPERHDYADLVERALTDLPRGDRFLPSVLPGWDNTPRSGRRGLVIEGATPALFARYVQRALDHVR